MLSCPSLQWFATKFAAHGSDVGIGPRRSALRHFPRKKKAAVPVEAHSYPLALSGLQKRWVPVARTGMRFRAPCEWHADQRPRG